MLKVVKMDNVTNIGYRKSGNLHYIVSETSDFCMETPWIRLLNISKVDDKMHELLISLVGKNSEDTKALRLFFKTLDSKIIEDIRTGKLEIMKNSSTKYKKLVRCLECQEEVNSTEVIKIKMLHRKTIIFDRNKNIIKPSNINMVNSTAFTYAKFILQFIVWFKKNTVGVHVRPVQMWM